MNEKNIILDFKEFNQVDFQPVYEDGLGGKGERNVVAHECNRKYFYMPRGVCPFCKIQIPKVLERNDFAWNKQVWHCNNCGWWELENVYSSGGVYDCIAMEGYYRYGIVKRFDQSDRNLPLDTLVNELNRRKNLLYKIHPTKMEELVKYVFESFYNCEVYHCGKSHDGGVDLVLINSEKPTLIQVKRRMNPESTESVSTIRDFLGAIMLNKVQNGIIVSTADHYSYESVKVSEKVIKENILSKFELINFKRFVEMLDVIGNKSNEPWKNYLEDYA